MVVLWKTHHLRVGWADEEEGVLARRTLINLHPPKSSIVMVHGMPPVDTFVI